MRRVEFTWMWVVVIIALIMAYLNDEKKPNKPI